MIDVHLIMTRTSQIQKAIAILMALFSTYPIYGQINFSLGSNYKYLKGSEASTLASNWYSSGFDDSSWHDGIAPFRYGDGAGGTELTDMQGNYSTLFLRTTFNVENSDTLKDVIVTADWDDGFVLWINGIEVLAQQAPVNYTYDAVSSNFHEHGDTYSFVLDASEMNLSDGINTIAVFGCNADLSTSSDFYFDMTMEATIPIPTLPELNDLIGIDFSHESGFYGSNFNLTMKAPQPDVQIVYTLDGSNPQTSSTRITTGVNTSVSINPNSTANRGTTPAVLVRASIIKDGYGASKPSTRTFIFLDAVKEQSYPGDNWPTYDVNGQIIDLNVDQNISKGSKYGSVFNDAMLDIPTLSIVTDNINLFNPISGIYVNAWGHGREWERECSFELIQPDGSEGFNVNAGVRIRGGWSRHNDYPKHSFRIFFRSEYGDSKLKFPLYGEDGAEEFDKVDLRTSQNYSWATGDSRNTMVREVFSRDSQRDMEQPYTRSSYYHLYVNGMYWGVFQTQERSEARFAADYFGGNKDDYDVVKVGTDNWSYSIEATDGNLVAWDKIWDMTQSGFESNEAYFALEGKNAKGKDIKTKEVLVDIDNLIDYMMTIFYTGNFDAPTSSFGGNNGANNFYAIYNRNNRSNGFKFFNHDAEHSLFSYEASPGRGLEEDRVNLDLNVTNFDVFHPQWLHFKLSKNEEYRQRFADRAMKHLSDGGVFTEDKCLERFNTRVEELEMAIIGESARWGDRNGGSAYTKDDHWIPELDKVRYDFFSQRTNIVWDQLLTANLLSTVSTPRLETKGERIETSRLFTTEALGIVFEKSGTGDMYYTLNGTDPRLIGGDISNDAILIESGSSIYVPYSAVIKARVKQGDRWSSLKELDIISEIPTYAHLKVTELNYHPLDSIKGTDTTSNKSFEFIEFKNNSETNAVCLTGVKIDSAIRYQFPEYFLLAPQQFFVIASEPGNFYDRYGMVASGNYKKNFSNSGERVMVISPRGDVIMDFRYSDQTPWPESADGQGRSLTANSKNPWANPADFTYWMRSSVENGTPFADDEQSSDIKETIANTPNGMFNAFPNPTSNNLQINYTGDESVFYSIKLYNVNGQLVFEQDANDVSIISLDDLGVSVGVYMLNIEYNGQISTQKVVYTP